MAESPEEFSAENSPPPHFNMPNVLNIGRKGRAKLQSQVLLQQKYMLYRALMPTKKLSARPVVNPRLEETIRTFVKNN